MTPAELVVCGPVEVGRGESGEPTLRVPPEARPALESCRATVGHILEERVARLHEGIGPRLIAEARPPDRDPAAWS
jgi:hypothetical protein